MSIEANWKVRLRDKMMASFTVEELMGICFVLGVDFEDIPSGNKSIKTIELIKFFNRRGEINTLISCCNDERPSGDWEQIEQDANNDQFTQNTQNNSKSSPNMPGKSRACHSYSGIWDIRSSFALWKGLSLKKPDSVNFEGKAFLVISEDGQEGSGIQIGNMIVSFERIGYFAKYDILNEVQRISISRVGETEILSMRVKVIKRICIVEKCPKGYEDFISHLSKDLDNKSFDMELKLVLDKPYRLQGIHIFEKEVNENSDDETNRKRYEEIKKKGVEGGVENNGNENNGIRVETSDHVYQKAFETHDYLGFFKSPIPLDFYKMEYSNLKVSSKQSVHNNSE